jgi:hypothetical protein
MIGDGGIDKAKTLWVDAYNRSTSEETSGTITTRVDASCNSFISERTYEKIRD